MKEPLARKITWRRRGVRRAYVGTIAAGPDGIYLTGRDPLNGIEVSLSIPLDEIERVDVGDDEFLAGARSVVIELGESQAIFLSEPGRGPANVHLLARHLGALWRRPAVLVQGGSL